MYVNVIVHVHRVPVMHAAQVTVGMRRAVMHVTVGRFNSPALLGVVAHFSRKRVA